jgi:hypothetical protein
VPAAHGEKAGERQPAIEHHIFVNGHAVRHHSHIKKLLNDVNNVFARKRFDGIEAAILPKW